jgi:intracellular septation protein A
MSRWVRVLVGLGIAVITCGFYLWFFGVQTFIALEARYIAWKMPIVNKVPVELPDLSVSQASGKKLSCFGYEFEVPWDDIDQAKS